MCAINTEVLHYSFSVTVATAVTEACINCSFEYSHLK